MSNYLSAVSWMRSSHKWIGVQMDAEKPLRPDHGWGRAPWGLTPEDVKPYKGSIYWDPKALLCESVVHDRVIWVRQVNGATVEAALFTHGGKLVNWHEGPMDETSWWDRFGAINVKEHLPKPIWDKIMAKGGKAATTSYEGTSAYNAEGDGMPWSTVLVAFLGIAFLLWKYGGFKRSEAVLIAAGLVLLVKLGYSVSDTLGKLNPFA